VHERGGSSRIEIERIPAAELPRESRHLVDREIFSAHEEHDRSAAIRADEITISLRTHFGIYYRLRVGDPIMPIRKQQRKIGDARTNFRKAPGIELSIRQQYVVTTRGIVVSFLHQERLTGSVEREDRAVFARVVAVG
jgi:hypothetical protein